MGGWVGLWRDARQRGLTFMVMFCFVSRLANAALVGAKTVMPAGCPNEMLPESPAQYREERKELRL